MVLIGEIRDGETAQIAVQASLTGHLVLSTLHTNTAIGAVTRLRDMGSNRFCFRVRSAACWRSAWCAGCARSAVSLMRCLTRSAACWGCHRRRR